MEIFSPDPVLVVVDSNGGMRGLGKFSFLATGKKSLRFNIPRKRGFDCYVLDPKPEERPFVLVLDASNTRVLATVPPHVPTEQIPAS